MERGATESKETIILRVVENFRLLAKLFTGRYWGLQANLCTRSSSTPERPSMVEVNKKCIAFLKGSASLFSWCSTGRVYRPHRILVQERANGTGLSKTAQGWEDVRDCTSGKNLKLREGFSLYTGMHPSGLARSQNVRFYAQRHDPRVALSSSAPFFRQ